MDKKEALKKVKTLLGIQVKLEQMKLDNGAIFEAEVFEAGQEIFVIADDERVAVPVGEYESEGKIIVVAEEGIISEIKEGGEQEEEAPAQEEVIEEEMSNEPASPKKIVESISKEQFFSEIEKLRNEIAELKLSKEPKEVKEVELSEEVEGINHNPEAQTEKRKMNLYSQKKRISTLDRVFKNLNKK